MSNILLGVTGSVAALRTPKLVNVLITGGHQVKVVATESSLYFFETNELPAGILHRDADEWPEQRYRRDDPVLHIELRRWADLFLIAPLDANTLAKLAYGLADNCLCCVGRAWDMTKPMILAPAMNTMMWEQPITARQFRQLAQDRGMNPPPGSADQVTTWINQQQSGLTIVGPIEKRLACGDVGVGGMSEVPDIVSAVQTVLQRSPKAG
jgi:phosphopantothenoylcysteine decarboxylase